MNFKNSAFVLLFSLIISPLFARIKTTDKLVMKKYFLHGKLVAKEGTTDKLTSILLDASQLVSTAKGCILYVIGRDTNDNHSVWITEIWDSKEDHDNSLKVASVRELISQAISLLDGQPEKGQELEILGGKGLN